MSILAPVKKSWKFLAAVVIGAAVGAGVFMLTRGREVSRPYMTLPPTAKKEEAPTPPTNPEELIWRSPDGQVFMMHNRKDWKTTVKPRIPREGINSGFVIAHGHFIPRPYKIARKGDFITINDVPVGMLQEQTYPAGPARLKDPGEFAWPKGCQGDPPGFRDYLHEKWLYLFQEYGDDMAAKALAQIIARQPGIESVEVRDRFRIRYRCINGDYKLIGIQPLCGPAVSEADRQREYAQREKQFLSFLDRGGMLVVSTPTGQYEGNSLKIWVAPANVTSTLRKIAGVMLSGESTGQRFEQLAAILEEPNVAREMAENLEVNNVLREAAGQ